ncbi:hypothetical protein DL771_000715 [Monosporascus sp. 5C6A]|nr:hypothetical protein DL771_000715 [Monosporascus sp. 5C6A]
MSTQPRPIDTKNYPMDLGNEPVHYPIIVMPGGRSGLACYAPGLMLNRVTVVSAIPGDTSRQGKKSYQAHWEGHERLNWPDATHNFLSNHLLFFAPVVGATHAGSKLQQYGLLERLPARRESIFVNLCDINVGGGRMCGQIVQDVGASKARDIAAAKGQIKDQEKNWKSEAQQPMWDSFGASNQKNASGDGTGRRGPYNLDHNDFTRRMRKLAEKDLTLPPSATRTRRQGTLRIDIWLQLQKPIDLWEWWYGPPCRLQISKSLHTMKQREFSLVRMVNVAAHLARHIRDQLRAPRFELRLTLFIGSAPGAGKTNLAIYQYGVKESSGKNHVVFLVSILQLDDLYGSFGVTKQREKQDQKLSVSAVKFCQESSIMDEFHSYKGSSLRKYTIAPMSQNRGH